MAIKFAVFKGTVHSLITIFKSEYASHFLRSISTKGSSDTGINSESVELGMVTSALL